MQLLLSVLQSENKSAHQESLRTVGLLAQELGASFGPYMSIVWPSLSQALKNTNSPSEYITAVLVVSDISRALEEGIAGYCDEIVNALLAALSSPVVQSRAKAPTLSAIGDIALAISGNFARYASTVLTLLKQASEFRIDNSDPDAIKMRNELWEGILTAYSGIIVGMRDSSGSDFQATFQYQVGNIVDFITVIANAFALNKPSKSQDDVLRGAYNVIGDLAQSSPQFAVRLRLPVIEKLVEISISMGGAYSEKTREAAKFARSHVYGGF